MKYYKYIKTVLLVITIWLLSVNADAQSFSFGPSLIYGDDIEQLGIHARAYYNLKGDRICFGPEFSYFPKVTKTINGEEISKELNEVNFNIHYIIELNHKWGVYPLVGLNMSYEKEEIELPSGEREVEKVDAFGTNLGFGIHRTANRWVIFAEFDHLFSDLSQNSFLIGTFYTIGKKKEKEEE